MHWRCLDDIATLPQFWVKSGSTWGWWGHVSAFIEPGQFSKHVWSPSWYTYFLLKAGVPNLILTNFADWAKFKNCHILQKVRRARLSKKPISFQIWNSENRRFERIDFCCCCYWCCCCWCCCCCCCWRCCCCTCSGWWCCCCCYCCCCCWTCLMAISRFLEKPGSGTIVLQSSNLNFTQHPWTALKIWTGLGFEIVYLNHGGGGWRVAKWPKGAGFRFRKISSEKHASLIFDVWGAIAWSGFERC